MSPDRHIIAPAAPLAAALLATLAFTHGASAAAPAGDVGLLLATMNGARVAQHLVPLRLDLRLSRVAYAHAADMLRRHYIEHATPEGRSPFDRLRGNHIRFTYAAENVALDQSARSVFADFWGSLAHRSNMLGAHYVRVGIASIDAPIGTIVVEDFSD